VFVATSTTATSTFSTGGLDRRGDQFVIQSGNGFVGLGTSTPFARMSISG